MKGPPKKKAPVEVVKDQKSGVEVVVYYDREARQFYGEVPQIGESRGPELQAVIAEIRANLERARAFEWKGVITIEHGGGHGSIQRSMGRGGKYRSVGASLSFQFWRSEIAPKPGAKGHDARFVERPHHLDVDASGAPPWLREYRDAGTDVHDHYDRSAGQEVVPYSDEAWAALFRLKEATERTHAQLVELFKRPEALVLVARGEAPKLLAVEAGTPRGRIRRATRAEGSATPCLTYQEPERGTRCRACGGTRVEHEGRT